MVLPPERILFARSRASIPPPRGSSFVSPGGKCDDPSSSSRASSKRAETKEEQCNKTRQSIASIPLVFSRLFVVVVVISSVLFFFVSSSSAMKRKTLTAGGQF